MSVPLVEYDFSKSDLLLMVGGQIMLLAVVIMVVWFGVGPIQFAYVDQMRNMLSVIPSVSVAPSANVAANTSASASASASVNAKRNDKAVPS
jgi:hypothetical protein